LKVELSASEARRVALAAQGFNAMRRHEAVGAAQLRKGVDRLGLLQIDSVNILVRAQYVPFFSRLGLYEPALLDALTAAKPKRFFEYWGARGVAAVHRLPTAAALAYGPRTSRPGRVAATRTLCGGEAGRGRSPAIRDGLLWMSSW
jgi:hypothetical protein